VGVKWWCTIFELFGCPSQLGGVVMDVANAFNSILHKTIIQELRVARS